MGKSGIANAPGVVPLWIRNITRTDELIIAYLREIKARDGHILAAAQHVPELKEDA